MNRLIKRTLFILLISIIFGIGMTGIINYNIINFSSKYIVSLEDAPKCEAALVLGALVYNNERVSPILQDRLDMGIELYKNNIVQKVLLSGDHGRKLYDEVNAMKKYVISQNVPVEDIFLDHAGFNTYDSLYRAKHIFQAKKIIIVTQEYHLPRAIYIARKLGIEAYGVIADKHIYPKMPLYKSRESLARVKDYILVNFLKPKSRYLGEIIDLSGDGRVTDDKK
ncbi:SanA/YdcF family protein [Caloranaerobacter ferrireducens]|uniref:SanA/YdcF family protein n=1 Tax=Caloranaerobacter ferrireducens TaxID=1323370 RepID=UPI00084DFC69|nr:ElyC/SanA/YdcF family protein [Caloranaerobacter ferrireducens]